MAAAPSLLRHSAAIFAMRLTGAGVIFVLQAAIARWWGVEQLGQYLLVIAAINLTAVAMPLGYQVIGTYFAAEYSARAQGRMLRRFAARGYLHVGMMTSVLAAIGVACGWRFIPLPALAYAGPAAVALAAVTAVTFVGSSLLVGLKRPLIGFLPDTLLKPLALLAGFGAAICFGSSHTQLRIVLWTAALACIAAAVFQGWRVWCAIRTVPARDDAQPGEARRWWRFALPWTLLTLAADLFFDLDLLLLSPLLPIDDLAVFGVCTRLFGLVAFGTATIYAIALPHSISADPQRENTELCRRMADANVLAAAFAVTAAIGAIFAGPLLGLFGPAFEAGAPALAILCLGLVARSVAGPGALVLSLHDRPAANLPPVALGMAVLIVSNLVLAPRFGVIGAAWAATVAMTAWSAAQWFVTFRHTAMDVSVWPRLRHAAGLLDPR